MIDDCEAWRADLERLAADRLDDDLPGWLRDDDVPPPGDKDAPSDKDAPTGDGARGEKLATRLVGMVRERATLWSGTDDQPYITIAVDEHDEHWPIRRGRELARWIARLAYRELKATPSASMIADVTNVLAGIARYDGEVHPVHLRVAADADRVVIDLCDRGWRAVVIDRDGWNVTDTPPVRFRRRAGMAALPAPASGGLLAELREHVRVTDDAWPLVVGWLVGAMSPRGPYPALVLRGRHGTGKSITARRLRSLVDPSAAPIRVEPREARDLVIAASNSWVVAYDNVSRLPQWLSDGLCRLATGGGYSARALYTDDDEVILDVQRPVILTGITDVVAQPDLLDRSLLVELEPIDDTARATEADLDQRWESARPRILGALCNAVSTALRRRSEIRLPRLPRMADWARWATAAEPAMAVENGGVVIAHTRSGEDATQVALDASPIAAPIIDLVSEDEWCGTASALLAELAERVDPAIVRRRTWPATARGMASALMRVAPSLAAVGVRVERQLTRGRRGGYPYRIWSTGSDPRNPRDPRHGTDSHEVAAVGRSWVDAGAGPTHDEPTHKNANDLAAPADVVDIVGRMQTSQEWCPRCGGDLGACACEAPPMRS